MLNYTRDAEKLIKNVRWWRVRLRVRRALEKAYRDGLHDALDKVLEHNSELSDSIRELGSIRPALPLPIPHVTH
jgi:hypothetical protein